MNSDATDGISCGCVGLAASFVMPLDDALEFDSAVDIATFNTDHSENKYLRVKPDGTISSNMLQPTCVITTNDMRVLTQQQFIR